MKFKAPDIKIHNWKMKILVMLVTVVVISIITSFKPNAHLQASTNRLCFINGTNIVSFDAETGNNILVAPVANIPAGFTLTGGIARRKDASQNYVYLVTLKGSGSTTDIIQRELLINKNVTPNTFTINNTSNTAYHKILVTNFSVANGTTRFSNYLVDNHPSTQYYTLDGITTPTIRSNSYMSTANVLPPILNSTPYGNVSAPVPAISYGAGNAGASYLIYASSTIAQIIKISAYSQAPFPNTAVNFTTICENNYNNPLIVDGGAITISDDGKLYTMFRPHNASLGVLVSYGNASGSSNNFNYYYLKYNLISPQIFDIEVLY
jgi:hypothetical protein